MRAYGGWYDKNGLTNKGSDIQQKLGIHQVESKKMRKCGEGTGKPYMEPEPREDIAVRKRS